MRHRPPYGASDHIFGSIINCISVSKVGQMGERGAEGESTFQMAPFSLCSVPYLLCVVHPNGSVQK